MKKKFIKITLNLSDETYKFVKQMAEESGNSIAATIRFIIWNYIKEQEICNLKRDAKSSTNKPKEK